LEPIGNSTEEIAAYVVKKNKQHGNFYRFGEGNGQIVLTEYEL
jgi:hypothetical protein